LSNLLKRATIVKGSDREMALLDAESRAQLETTILIVTHGGRGSLIRHVGKEHAVPAIALPVTNTIGAGDTYLAGFVYAFLRGASPVEAAQEATCFTARFLKERLA
jgi:sugar/nucleoside kinase (ribokinase family)